MKILRIITTFVFFLLIAYLFELILFQGNTPNGYSNNKYVLAVITTLSYLYAKRN